jgi:cyclophilin family peptidyl-prolyl cis-trans isomerase
MEHGGVAGTAGSSQTGATGTGMPETGTAQPSATTGGAMAQPGAPAGTTAQAGTSGATGAEQAGGMEHPKKHHKMKKHHEGATGGSAAGATGAGGQEFAMQNSLEVYNKSYATCLKGRGYVVETTGP